MYNSMYIQLKNKSMYMITCVSRKTSFQFPWFDATRLHRPSRSYRRASCKKCDGLFRNVEKNEPPENKNIKKQVIDISVVVLVGEEQNSHVDFMLRNNHGFWFTAQVVKGRKHKSGSFRHYKKENLKLWKAFERCPWMICFPTPLNLLISQS